MPSGRASTTSVVSALIPIMALVVVAYFVTGIAMPVLPIHVREGLGLGPFVGTYTAFLDWSLGVASPTLGFIAEAVSLSTGSMLENSHVNECTC